MATTWALTMDCAQPRQLAEFWKSALGYVDAPPPQGFDSWEEWFVACEVPENERDDGASIVDPDGVAPGISMLRVPEGKRAKNRVHIDVKVSGGRAEPADVRRDRIMTTVERLAAAGAAVLAEYAIAGQLDHVMLADPEGNEFCVV